MASLSPSLSLRGARACAVALAFACASLTTVASPPLAAAPAAAPDPVVLAVTGEDIYVELGAEHGVGAGSQLELLHEVVARDPRNGAVLRDRFAIGTLRVVKSGARLSVARAEGALAGRVLAGDRVRLLSAPRKLVDPWAAKIAASRGVPAPAPTPAAPTPAGQPPATLADHVARAGRAWQETLGQSEAARIERWRQLLAADPATPYRAAVEQELASLQVQLAEREAALERARSQRAADRQPRVAQLVAELPPPPASEDSAATSDDDEPALLRAAPLPRVAPGSPLELAFLVADPAALEQAWLFVRAPGEPGFRRLELVADGDAYLRARVAAELVRAPRLEWYVEARRRAPPAPSSPAAVPGSAVAVLGTRKAPIITEVDPIVVEEPIARGRSHVDAHVDYVDFDGQLGDGFDQYYQAELDFTYRFLTPVYAVRLGFGTLSGTGGPKDVIDDDPTDRCLDAGGNYRCSKVAFSYVYTEVELRISPRLAVLLRPQAGLLTTDRALGTDEDRCSGDGELEDCYFQTRYGGRARVRFGDETGTNLVVGAGFTRGVGTLLEAAYQWLPTPTVPVQLLVQVTDMPVPENLGVRLVADVGWRKLAFVYPSLRVSYQARDIDHAGFSGGLALSFDW